MGIYLFRNRIENIHLKHKPIIHKILRIKKRKQFTTFELMDCAKSLIYFFSVMFLFTSCNRSGEVEEGDRNTYTVKGRFYKGVSDEPYANAPLKLELGYGPSYDNQFEVIARTTTDEDGNFSMTYRKIKKLGPVLDLFMENPGYTSGFSLLELPVNQDVTRDVAEINHTRLYVDINFSNKTQPDTLYLSLQTPYDSKYLQKFSFSDSTFGDYKKKFFCIPSEDFDHPEVLKFGLPVQWHNEKQILNPGYGYGFTRKEIKMSGTSATNDTVPDNFQSGLLEYRGFPYVDTLTLNF